ncbi:MAG: Mur ligase family protein, partial [Planctomycetota bacterium]
MRLEDLIRGLPITVNGGDGIGMEIEGVTEDSRRVGPGWLFVARPGTMHDGAAFCQDAVDRGAIAILCREPIEAPVSILLCDDPATVGAMVFERWHGSPGRSLRLMGVTGTNGKTTVAWLVRQILNLADTRCGLIGTIEIDEGDGGSPASLTTPAAEDISGSLSRMVANGCKAAALEVSSHALEQRRAAALDFEVAVFTNLSGDHLDYHGSMEGYAAAKARLFEGLESTAIAIVNS